MSNLKLKHPDFNAGDYKFNTVEVLSTLIQQTMQLRLAMTMRKVLHTAE